MNKSISFSWKSLRGGSWVNDQRGARAASRHYGHPDDRYDYVGFRVISTKREENTMSKGKRKVVRGGSWYDDQRLARCTFRLRSEPENFHNNLGFRVLGRKK